MTRRVAINSNRQPSDVPPPGPEEVQAFHRGLPGYAVTPVHRLEGDVFLKDESDRLGLPAFKIVGASWAVHRLLRERPGTRRVVAASAGNHGRAVARAAVARSLACTVYLPASSGAMRASLIEGEGAEVVRVDGSYEVAVAEAQRAAARPGTALLADTSDVPGSDSASWVVDGYSTIFRELATQMPDGIGVLLVPAGVGSLLAAAVRWAIHEQPRALVIAVEPSSADCVTASIEAGRPVVVPTPGTTMAGLNCATPSAHAWPTLRAGLLGALTVTDAETHAAMRALAARGITAGDCGAASVAALSALRSEAACGPLRLAADMRPGRVVVCLSTEGASDPEAYARILAGG